MKECVFTKQIRSPLRCMPILRILGLLTVSVGLLYFLLSTTTPLVQAWYARTHKTALPEITGG
jgi:hypothetical protein